MRVFQSLWCLVGIHRRSRDQAHQHGLAISSVCRGCHRSMVKDGRRWLITARRSPHAN